MSWSHVLRALRTLGDGPAPEPPAPIPAATADGLAERLDEAAKARLGRSLVLHHVATGGCNGCELELRMLDGLVYDLRRFGLRFAATPRHADVLLCTGPVTRALHEALLRCWEAMPEPRWVVSVGECAADGGVFRGSYAVLGGVGTALPVDLAIRGCPPTPGQVLAGLRALLEAAA